ncbi:anti-sigma factor [Pedobacter sp. Du54]|uniref:anti-sigma factor n=1 Tax=Pedobacter anseongensis TaxID=3133439 RepID=UPI0030A382C9
MEEAKAYIESGILELYVLGQLSAIECSEVEEMASKHPEVKAEILAIELALETYAIQNAIEPAAKTEEKLFAALSPKETEQIVTDTKIISLYDNANDGKVRRLRYALVACSILLAISLGALFSAHKELKDANFQIANLSSDKEKFASTASKLEFENAGMENRIAMTETDEWTTVKLSGVKNSPKAKMLVYWNKTNKNILINYSAMELPKTDQSHEYQLWALVDGKPVSLGVFTSNESAKEAVLQMETIEKAQAFAVTIEPNGGSANPTMEKMVVMGAI